MKLQVAMDADKETTFRVLDQIYPAIDIVEIGTPLIFQEGLSIVSRIREKYPHLTVLADLKIIDAGEYEASLAYQAGADIVTLLGVASDQTILGALKAAYQYAKQIMVDMMQVQDLIVRSRWLNQKGADYICVHLAHDLQGEGKSPYADLRSLREALPQAKLAVAGGISSSVIAQINPLCPEIVIVGKAILMATEPGEMAQSIRKQMLDE